MDPEAPMTVVKGILGLGTASTAYAALIAVAKSQNPFAFGINGAIGGGTVGLSYFALREYIISPLLVTYLPYESYTIRRDILSHARATLRASSHPRSSIPLNQEEQDELVDALRLRESTDRTLIRWNKLLDSGLAGAVTGGGLGYWAQHYRRMAISAPRSAVQLGALTGLTQFLINNLRILRLGYLASQSDATEPTSLESISPVEPGQAGIQGQSRRQTGGASLEDVMQAEKRHWPLKEQSLYSESAPDPLPRSIPSVEASPGSAPETLLETKPTVTERLKTYFASLSPIRRLSDEEYHSILLTQRSELLDRLSAARSAGSKGDVAGETGGWLGGSVGAGNGESELERQLDMLRGKLEGLEERMGKTGS